MSDEVKQAEVERIICARCSVSLPAIKFKVKRCGNHQKQCVDCNAKHREYCRKLDASRVNQCPQCQKKYARKHALQRHILTVHGETQQHKCSECPQTFNRADVLHMHINAVHLKLKPHKCPHCDMKFTTKSKAVDHINAVHLKLKPHKCQHCDMKFSTVKGRKRHVEEVHLKLKPHKCNHCKCAFAQAVNLRTHIATVHEKRRDFECQECGKTFGQPSHLKTHSKICTGDKHSHKSGGELACMKVMDLLGVKYQEEYTFPDCRNVQPLPFDFWLPNHKLLIEFDGGQHFKAVKYFGGQAKFEETQRHDAIKNKYALDNNIPLLRIPYMRIDDVYQLIEEFVNEHSA